MQRLQLTAFGKPSEVVVLNRTAETPALTSNEVLVKMEAAPINPSDLMIVEGKYGFRPQFPFHLGSEGVGRIVRIGSEAEPELLGKRVMILPTYEAGTWADHLILSPQHLVTVDENADALQLAMIGINPATAYLLLNRFAALKPGEWVAQTAANAAMGQYIIQFAKLAGLKTLNVVRREDAVDRVRQFGGDRVVVQSDHLAQDIEKALSGEKLSLVLDTVGGSPVGALAQSLRNGGVIVGYAMQSGEFAKVSPADFFYRGLSLHGFWLINWIRSAPREEIESVYGKLSALVADGTLSANVEATYSLSDYASAIEHALQPQRFGKILFRF